MSTLSKDIFKDLLFNRNRLDILKLVEDVLQRNKSRINGKLDFLINNEYNIRIPVLYVEKRNPYAPYILIMGAQHNEFNGTFGILNFIESKKFSNVQKWLETTQGGIAFIPLFNIYGFLNPRIENKWGYFVNKDFSNYGPDFKKINCNRYWRHVLNEDAYKKHKHEMPIENQLLGQFILSQRKNGIKEHSNFIILDFHETSMVYRFSKEIAKKFNDNYKLDHWMKRLIVEESLKKLELPYQKKEKEIKIKNNSYYKKVREFLASKIQGRENKTFYFFSFANTTRKYAYYIDKYIFKKYKEELFPLFKRAMLRPYVYSGSFSNIAVRSEWYMPLLVEMRKIFFNLREEQEKVKKNPDYFKTIWNVMKLNVRITKDIIDLFFIALIKENNSKEY